MYILGIHGSPVLKHERSAERGWPFDIFHDASAVLLKDGVVVAGIAQERLDRIKHSNAFPIDAIRFCLEYAGIGLSEISHIAYPNDENVMNDLVSSNRREVVRGKLVPLSVSENVIRGILRGLLRDAFAVDVSPERITFVPHHHAHAMSAFAHSGFDEALIYVRDGWGDDLSGIVAIGKGDDVAVLNRSAASKSLGHFYLTGTEILGYHLGDEYKMMGLAPYGDPTRYQAMLDRFVSIQNDGPRMDLKGMWDAFVLELGGVRTRNSPFETKHEHVAAAFQYRLETIALDELRFWQRETGQRNLCCAGGVAQNCSLNGKILAGDMFDKVFVPAAPDDGGLALGAALTLHHSVTERPAKPPPARICTVSWGSDIRSATEIVAALRPWHDIIAFERIADIVPKAANALAGGKVIGWARGRSEFGPRALGHRSILADPRPAANRSRINQIVKKRESFRPFAPSVLDDRVSEFFEVQEHWGEFAFMTFVVMVRERYRSLLGAITHVDGSARIQSVSRSDNPDYWELIASFGDITGVPMLLNTSFNNNAEPIVESIEDAVVCFLTTDLDHLVVGDFWIERRLTGSQSCSRLVPSLPVDSVLECSQGPTGEARYTIASKQRYGRGVEIDEPTFRALSRPHWSAGVGEVSIEVLYALWCDRMIRMTPAVTTQG